MDFKDSKTYKNLQSAYEGESKASTKYRIYGAKAREDGFEQIGNIFDTTSHNEQEHGEIWLKLLNDGEIPDTLTNLRDASKGEQFEWSTMYQDYANTADDEGFPEIANLFRGVAGIEKHHDYRFSELAKNIETNEVFCKTKKVVWICLNCGNVVWDICAPEVCPVCGYPRAYYELNCENY